MTPKEAIRKYCFNFCMNKNNVDLCTSPECSLYDYRKSKSKDRKFLAAIKARCKDCSIDVRPKDCIEKECQLWIYRLGHNPARKGIGNKSPSFAKKP